MDWLLTRNNTRVLDVTLASAGQWADPGFLITGPRRSRRRRGRVLGGGVLLPNGEGALPQNGVLTHRHFTRHVEIRLKPAKAQISSSNHATSSPY